MAYLARVQCSNQTPRLSRAYTVQSIEPPQYTFFIQALQASTISSNLSTLGENIALKGSGRTVPESVKFIVSIGAAGSSRMLKAHNSRAVLIKTELRADDTSTSR